MCTKTIGAVWNINTPKMCDVTLQSNFWGCFVFLCNSEDKRQVWPWLRGQKTRQQLPELECQLSEWTVWVETSLNYQLIGSLSALSGKKGFTPHNSSLKCFLCEKALPFQIKWRSSSQCHCAVPHTVILMSDIFFVNITCTSELQIAGSTNFHSSSFVLANKVYFQLFKTGLFHVRNYGVDGKYAVNIV